MRLVKLFIFFIFLLTSHQCVTIPERQNLHSQRITKILDKQQSLVYTPKEYSLKKVDKKLHRYENFDVILFAEEWKQGNLAQCVIPIYSKDIKIYSATFNQLPILLYKKRNVVFGFFPIDPEASLEDNILTIEYSNGEEKNVKRIPIDIEKQNWLNSSTAIALRLPSVRNESEQEEIQKRIYNEKLLIRKALSKKDVFNIGKRKSHPRDLHYITSEFWKMRLKEYYRRNKKGKKIKVRTRRSIHKGLDLRGRKGDVIYAIANGKVVLTGNFIAEGLITIIYHGHGIFSGYMHQSKISVRRNNRVRAGQVIGFTGNTGLSQASHLHIFLYQHGSYLDPLSILSLPLIYF